MVAVNVTVVIPTLKVEPPPSPFPFAIVAPVNAYVTTGAGVPVDEEE